VSKPLGKLIGKDDGLKQTVAFVSEKNKTLSLQNGASPFQGIIFNDTPTRYPLRIEAVNFCQQAKSG
jgi:hypothetical protein